MHDPYRMIIVNLLATLLLIIGILVYKFIYPKKQISLFVLLILISILPVISIFRPGVYESGDISFHISENMVFYRSLSEGNIIPIWSGDMNGTYGYPLFTFFYPLPFYLMSFIHFIGFSFVNSAKILLAGAYILSGIFMYRWLKKILNKTGAFVGALFYLFAPYHLVDLHFRADVGEVLAFVFIPLGLYAATNLLASGKSRWFLLEAFAVGALLLSHPAISFESIPAMFLYSILLIKNPIKNKKQFCVQIAAFLAGFFLIAFYWFPLFYDLRYTYSNAAPYISFTTLPELLYSPWRLGLLFQGPSGQLGFLMGYAQILVLLGAIVFLAKKRIEKKYINLLILSLIIIFCMIFMMLSISKPLWFAIPLMKNFQFSYRLLGITIFALSVVAAIIAVSIKKKWLLILLCCFVVLSTILNWGNRRTLPDISDNVLQQELPQETQMGGLAQAVTVWSNPNHPWTIQVPKTHMEILKGKGTITDISRQTNKHVYKVTALTQLYVRENTLYYPSWHLYIDGQPQKITILLHAKPQGIISFTIPKGNHVVELKFLDSMELRIGETISFITVVVIFVFASLNKKLSISKTKKQKK